MRSYTIIALLLAGFAATPALAQSTTEVEGEGVGLDAWHMDYLYTLVTEQLDPIVSPNRQSSHMHRVLGGSNFAAAYNFDELRASSCTSASISIDHSSYWSPQLYWIVDPSNPGNTTFLQLPSYNRFYYFLGRNDPTVPVIPFPKGFRMLAGDPNRKSANPIFVYECHRNPDLSGSISRPSFNFDDSCKYGVKFDLTFPSCWDGVNLYKTDGSHVAYPLSSIRDGGCPVTHPKRLPSILLEYTYHPEAYPAVTKGQNMSGHLAWANGDTTSFGLHADFLNGWDVDILGKALNDPGCVNLGHSIEIQKCPTLAPYFDMAAGKACKPSRGQLTEPFAQGDGNVIPKLPGCNPLWGASGSKPTCNPPPAGLDVSAFQSTDGPYVLPASQQTNSTLKLDQSKGWHSVACFDTTNSKPLGSTTLSYYDANMTPARCQLSCAKNGYSFAGLEVIGGFSCICSNSLNNQSAIAYSNCSTPCPSSSATCGGQYKQDIYYEAPTYVGRDPLTYDLGCYALPANSTSGGLIQASTYSFPSTSMTRDVCSQACVQKGAKWSGISDSKCYCGTNFDLGTGYFVPNDFCSLSCKGNTSETCGNYYNLNTFNLTNYASTAPRSNSVGAAGYQGCFAQGGGKLALSAYSFSDAKLIPEMCKSYCNQLGFSLAGTMNGNQCFCDNTFAGGQMLPDSQCGVACAGNSNLTCGAAYNLQLYNSSAAIYRASQATAAHPTGWQGCYAASLISSKVAYANYTIYPDTLSVSSCKTTCAYFGYPYMAVWGNSCNCGSQLVKTNRYADAFCNLPCKSSNETCGGSQYTDVYSVDASQAPDTTALRARGWVGCYNNPASGSALGNYSFADPAMTPQLCQSGCQKAGGWKFSGVNRNICTCGNVNMGTVQPPSSCSVACSGDATQLCGGPFSYSIYTSAPNTTAASTTTTATTTKANTTSVATSASSTTRTTTVISSSASSPAASAAVSANTTSVKTTSSVAGSSPASVSPAPKTSSSSVVSSATSATFAPAAASSTTYSGRGCIADGSTRALNGSATYASDMTIAKCSTFAQAAKARFFGLEAGNQCFTGGFLVYNTTSTNCKSFCAGDASNSTVCGGSYALSLYEFAPSVFAQYASVSSTIPQAAVSPTSVRTATSLITTKTTATHTSVTQTSVSNSAATSQAAPTLSRRSRWRR